MEITADFLKSKNANSNREGKTMKSRTHLHTSWTNPNYVNFRGFASWVKNHHPGAEIVRVPARGRLQYYEAESTVIEEFRRAWLLKNFKKREAALELAKRAGYLTSGVRLRDYL